MILSLQILAEGNDWVTYLIIIGVLAVTYFIHDRYLLPREIERDANRIVSKIMAEPYKEPTLAELTALENPRNGVVGIKDGEVILELKKTPRRSFPVDTIHKVIAYKADLYTTDLICLRIESSDQAIDIHEEMSGFYELHTTLSWEYGLFDESWVLDIAMPPFASNPTVLYEKQSQSES